MIASRLYQSDKEETGLIFGKILLMDCLPADWEIEFNLSMEGLDFTDLSRDNGVISFTPHSTDFSTAILILEFFIIGKPRCI